MIHIIFKLLNSISVSLRDAQDISCRQTLITPMATGYMSYSFAGSGSIFLNLDRPLSLLPARWI